MARIVSHIATGPLAVPKASAPGEALYVCRCGLSASPLGLCDGSHKLTRDEQSGQVYLYERRDGQLVRVATQVGIATAATPPLENAGGVD